MALSWLIAHNMGARATPHAPHALLPRAQPDCAQCWPVAPQQAPDEWIGNNNRVGLQRGRQPSEEAEMKFPEESTEEQEKKRRDYEEDDDGGEEFAEAERDAFVHPSQSATLTVPWRSQRTK